MKRVFSYILDHPVLLSTLAAVVSAFFAGVSYFLHHKTWQLLQRKARPWLFLESIVYENLSELRMTIKNAGEHPATNIRIKQAYAPSDKLEEKTEAKGKGYSNRIPCTWGSVDQYRGNSARLAPGESIYATFDPIEPGDHVVLIRLKYRDAFTSESLVEDFWYRHKASQNTPGIFEELDDHEIERAQPYFK